jgi:hypothetical protein
VGLDLDAFRPSGVYGYTCKVWLARKIEEEFSGSRYFVWFARRLNPLQNPASANPIEIYRVVNQAVENVMTPNPRSKICGLTSIWGFSCVSAKPIGRVLKNFIAS